MHGSSDFWLCVLGIVYELKCLGTDPQPISSKLQKIKISE